MDGNEFFVVVYRNTKKALSDWEKLDRPKTRFLRPSGQQVTAQDLGNSRFDVLRGPHDTEVRVTKVVKHVAEERTFVSLRTEGGGHPFVVAADHRLVVKDKTVRNRIVAAEDGCRRKSRHKEVAVACVWRGICLALRQTSQEISERQAKSLRRSSKLNGWRASFSSAMACVAN